MAKLSEAETPAITLEEVANDGSDLTNPAADHRRLFLGEDGNLHVKDSAGAVTDIGGGSGAVATDAIWDAAGDLAVGSGANTAARLAIGAAGGAVSRVNGAVAWNSGTSFPTAATGDRYWRTDLRMEFFYDGTRWVTTHLYETPVGVGGSLSSAITGTPTNVGRMAPDPDFDLWVEDFVTDMFVATTNSGSAYWSAVLNKVDASNSATAIGTGDTSAGSANTWYNAAVAVDAVVDRSTSKHFTVIASKTGSPGALTFAFSVKYRLIAT
jgi:hypothetical protein